MVSVVVSIAAERTRYGMLATFAQVHPVRVHAGDHERPFPLSKLAGKVIEVGVGGSSCSSLPAS